MFYPSSIIDQFKRLWLRFLLALLPCALAIFIVVLAYPTAGISYHEFFEDIYEISGSRWSGFMTYMGCLAWTVAASVCFVSAYFLRDDNRPQVKAWRAFFLFSGALSTILLFDDLMGLHELGDDIFMLITKREGEMSWSGKQMLESVFFLAYGIFFSTLVWHFRQLI